MFRESIKKIKNAEAAIESTIISEMTKRAVKQELT